MSSIVLYTVSGQIGEEPGEETLLVAVSSDSSIAGQCVIPVSGTLPSPVVVPDTDMSWLATMLVTDIRQHKGSDAEISVQLDFDTTAGVLSVRALTDGEPGPDDRRGVLGLNVSGDYPLDHVLSMLRVDPYDGDEQVWTRAVLPDRYLFIMASVARMNKEQVSLHPVRADSSKLVANLPRWRAVFPYGSGRESGDVVSWNDWTVTPKKSPEPPRK
jgi:hypothetical protein